jgi:hypothetical protein
MEIEGAVRVPIVYGNSLKDKEFNVAMAAYSTDGTWLLPGPIIWDISPL